MSNNLPDARNVDPVPVLQFNLGSPVTTQYVMFQIDSFYGKSGGLQYFATYWNCKPKANQNNQKFKLFKLFHVKQM